MGNPFEIRGYVECVKERMREKLDGLPEDFDPAKMRNLINFTERMITDHNFLAQQFVEYMRYEEMKSKTSRKRKK